MSSQNGDDDSKEPPAIKANKGMILRKSVDYIRYLQQLVTAQASRNRDLEAQVQHLQSRVVGSSPSISSPHSTDSAPEMNSHNFHVFGDELMNGLNGMGMVDILHGLNPEDSEAYMNMQYTNAAGIKSPNGQQRFEGLETLHEHANHEHRDFEGDPDLDHEQEGEMDMDDTSPSASADSPEERAPDFQAEKEEAQRGRARNRGRKPEEREPSDAPVKKESPMEA